MTATSAPRTYVEIVKRISERQAIDVMGFETSDLRGYLPYRDAAATLPSSVKEADWEQLPRDRDSVIAQMLDYMPFAWEKANDCKGLSAGRTMAHYSAWVWMAGDDLGELTEYEFYGKDNLVRICNHYGWDSSEWDDGIRTND